MLSGYLRQFLIAIKGILRLDFPFSMEVSQTAQQTCQEDHFIYQAKASACRHVWLAACSPVR